MINTDHYISTRTFPGCEMYDTYAPCRHDLQCPPRRRRDPPNPTWVKLGTEVTRGPLVIMAGKNGEKKTMNGGYSHVIAGKIIEPSRFSGLPCLIAGNYGARDKNDRNISPLRCADHRACFQSRLHVVPGHHEWYSSVIPKK